jgi:hypothetical protein
MQRNVFAGSTPTTNAGSRRIKNAVWSDCMRHVIYVPIHAVLSSLVFSRNRIWYPLVYYVPILLRGLNVCLTILYPCFFSSSSMHQVITCGWHCQIRCPETGNGQVVADGVEISFLDRRQIRQGWGTSCRSIRLRIQNTNCAVRVDLWRPGGRSRQQGSAAQVDGTNDHFSGRKSRWFGAPRFSPRSPNELRMLANYR